MSYSVIMQKLQTMAPISLLQGTTITSIPNLIQLLTKCQKQQKSLKCNLSNPPKWDYSKKILIHFRENLFSRIRPRYSLSNIYIFKSTSKQLSILFQFIICYVQFQPRTFLTKVDDSYPPVYYSGSGSALTRYFDKLAKPNMFDKTTFHDYRFDRRNEITNDLNDNVHADRFQSQNRMDEMELTDHNETFNKVLDYENFKIKFLNNKVRIFNKQV